MAASTPPEHTTTDTAPSLPSGTGHGLSPKLIDPTTPHGADRPDWQSATPLDDVRTVDSHRINHRVASRLSGHVYDFDALATCADSPIHHSEPNFGPCVCDDSRDDTACDTPDIEARDTTSDARHPTTADTHDVATTRARMSSRHVETFYGGHGHDDIHDLRRRHPVTTTSTLDVDSARVRMSSRHVATHDVRDFDGTDRRLLDAEEGSSTGDPKSTADTIHADDDLLEITASGTYDGTTSATRHGLFAARPDSNDDDDIDAFDTHDGAPPARTYTPHPYTLRSEPHGDATTYTRDGDARTLTMIQRASTKPAFACRFPPAKILGVPSYSTPTGHGPKTS